MEAISSWLLDCNEKTIRSFMDSFIQGSFTGEAPEQTQRMISLLVERGCFS